MVGFRGAFQENLFAPHLHKKPLYGVRDEIYITVFNFARKMQKGRSCNKKTAHRRKFVYKLFCSSISYEITRLCISGALSLHISFGTSRKISCFQNTLFSTNRLCLNQNHTLLRDFPFAKSTFLDRKYDVILSI